MDLHAADSKAAGILVEGNGRYLRNEQATNNAVGFKILSSSNTIHNGAALNNTGDGVYVSGSSNILTDTDSFGNGGNGFSVVGSSNQLLKLDAGDKGKGNKLDGIHVVGDSNLISEPGAFANGFTNGVANGGDGIDVAGKSNTILKAVAGDSGKGNGGDGVHVAGQKNLIRESKASSNTGDGYDVSGATTSADANLIRADSSNTGSSGSSSLENKGAEYRLLNYVKNDSGGNKADSVGIPVSTKCPSFPNTGNTSSSSIVCE
jgi:hypothetical protein